MSFKVVPALHCICLSLLFVNAAFGDGKPSAELPPGSVLQQNDEIAVRSLRAKEVSDKTFRLDQNGEVNFPLAGVVKLGGLTPREAEKALAEALTAYYKEPDIQISVVSFHVETLSVLGSVGTPGVYPVRGRMDLLEAVSSAGGVRGDAGPTLVLTRQAVYGPIPHLGARQLLSGESVVEIDLHDLMQGQNTADNIPVKPHDVISVPAAQLVYVVGLVKRSGGFPLAGRPSLTAIQAIALAEGLDPRASPQRVRILRRGGAGGDTQIPVNVKAILAGRQEDVVLRPNDILYVPSDAMKTITNRTIEAAIQIGTGLAIFHP
jgi:polysaccharide export outer membrane protein